MLRADYRAFRVATWCNLTIISWLAYEFVVRLGWFGVFPALLCLDAVKSIMDDAEIIHFREGD